MLCLERAIEMDLWDIRRHFELWRKLSMGIVVAWLQTYNITGLVALVLSRCSGANVVKFVCTSVLLHQPKVTTLSNEASLMILNNILPQEAS